MTSLVRGSLYMVGMRWTDRLIGLISTLVLARLLVPQDFGIIAMASLVISLADVMFDLGVHVALIQNKHPHKEHYDTAWTLGLIQSVATALLLWVLAPYAARYFHEPRIEDVIRVLGAAMLISGLENIGVVTFQKEMRFGQDYVLLFTKRFTGFVVTLVAAWLLQSYWAMVAGSVAGRLMGLICSYAMHPMRPRLSLVRLREIMGVSQWVLARTVGGYLESHLHRAVVARNSDASVMGAYTMAGDISSMPTTELLMPINRVMFPAFVRVKDRPEQLKKVFLQAQGVQSIIAIPASAGLALVAPQLIALMLGDKWALAVPFVQILALAYLASAMLSCATALLITLGHIKALAFFTGAQVLVFAVLAFVLFPAVGALQVAWMRLAVSLASELAFVAMLLYFFKALKLQDLLRGVVRPVLATCAMAAGLLLLEDYWGGSTALLLLPAKMMAGAAIYVASIALLWHAAGKPEGAESDVLRYLLRTRQEEHP